MRLNGRFFWAALAAFFLGVASGLALADSPPCFARLTADRGTPYAGEQFRLVLSIYSSGATLGRQIGLSGMPLPTVASIGPFEELANESTVIEERTYEVRRYRSRVRVHAAGPLRLAPQFQGTRVETVRNQWLTQTRETPVTVPVEPLVLNVLSVPTDGRPADFSGAIGPFSLSVTAAPLTVAVGDLVTVTMTVSGEGLPEGFTPPTVQPGPGIRLYEVKALPARDAADRRVFEQTVVAAEPSATAIPPVGFTFFDTRERRYQTATQGPFPLSFHVEKPLASAVYTPTISTAAAPVTTRSNLVTAPGRLARMWSAMTGQRYAYLRPAADGTARFAPGSEAPILFTVTSGVRVQIETETDGWARISCREGTGWLPVASLVRE